VSDLLWELVIPKIPALKSLDRRRRWATTAVSTIHSSGEFRGPLEQLTAHGDVRGELPST
jgi:hypothetical protein